MSIRWMDKVWRESPYEGKALLLHLACADFANDSGEFFGSQPVLARKARCSVEYVRQTMKAMTEDRTLLVLRVGSSAGRASEFRLLPWSVITDTPTELAPKPVGGNPPTADANPPTADASPPNSTPYHPSYNGTNNGPRTVAPGDADVVPIAEKKTGQRMQELIALYVEMRPMASGAHATGPIRAAIRTGYSDEAIAQALVGLVEENRSLTNETLRVALEGGPVLKQRRPFHGGLTPVEILNLDLGAAR